MTSGIYAIKNIANNKIYIGSSVNLERRKTQHFTDLKNGTHYNIVLHRAYCKYGKENFIFHVLELVDNINDLISIEQWWIDSCNPEYNIRPEAGSQLGYKHSDEAKYLIGLKNTGRLQSSETKEKRAIKLRKIVQQINLKTGLVIKTWNSISDAANELDIKGQHITAVCKNKRKSAGGYGWRYTNG